MNEDFYIGYLPKLPKSATRAVQSFVAAVFAAVILLTVFFWLGQKPFAKSVFEFGTIKEFEGTIQSGAVPFLLVEKTEKNNGLPTFERFPLVGEGKHGVDVERFDGQRVKLKGTRIYRDDLQMIEIVGESIENSAENSKAIFEAPESLGNFTLRGEIVDSKCYLGVMNPGASKPHRDCAVACLRGGVPALFIVKDTAGNVSELWLVAPNGTAVNRDVLDFVAEPLEIAGEVTRLGDQLFFKIDPKQIKRLGGRVY